MTGSWRPESVQSVGQTTGGVRLGSVSTTGGEWVAEIIQMGWPYVSAAGENYPRLLAWKGHASRIKGRTRTVGSPSSAIPLLPRLGVFFDTVFGATAVSRLGAGMVCRGFSGRPVRSHAFVVSLCSTPSHPARETERLTTRGLRPERLRAARRTHYTPMSSPPQKSLKINILEKVLSETPDHKKNKHTRKPHRRTTRGASSARAEMPVKLL